MRGVSGASDRGLSLYLDIHWNIFDKLMKRIFIRSTRLLHLISKCSFQDLVPNFIFVILYSFFSRRIPQIAYISCLRNLHTTLPLSHLLNALTKFISPGNKVKNTHMYLTKCHAYVCICDQTKPFKKRRKSNSHKPILYRSGMAQKLLML